MHTTLHAAITTHIRPRLLPPWLHRNEPTLVASRKTPLLFLLGGGPSKGALDRVVNLAFPPLQVDLEGAVHGDAVGIVRVHNVADLRPRGVRVVRYGLQCVLVGPLVR